MIILYWLIAIHLFTAVISYPFLKECMRKSLIDNPRFTDPINPDFLVFVTALVPIMNVRNAFLFLWRKYKLKRSERTLEKMAKDIKDPETKAAIENIAKGLKEYNKL